MPKGTTVTGEWWCSFNGTRTHVGTNRFFSLCTWLAQIEVASYQCLNTFQNT